MVAARTGLAATHPQVRRRLDLIAGDTDPAMLAALPLDAAPWQRVIDLLLVPETFLFRDPAQLALMTEAGLHPAIAGPPRRLHLWSAGCCTGEEAYSLAILTLQALCAAGQGEETTEFRLAPGWGCQVLGSDISAACIARAEAGAYEVGPLSSFRDTAADRLRYFPASGPAMRAVRSDIRRHVRFACDALLDARVGEPFDVVVCRNVLLYFTEAARMAALALLSEAVRPGGLLLLGPTDPPPDPARFAAVWRRDAVVYRREDAR